VRIDTGLSIRGRQVKGDTSGKEAPQKKNEDLNEMRNLTVFFGFRDVIDGEKRTKGVHT